jgi:hypothetical protein
MGSWIGHERRKHERLASSQSFNCFAGGRRFTTSVRDVSLGGAFLLVDRVLKPGTIIVLEQAKPDFTGRPAHLVAKVNYFAIKPQTGAGLSWLKAIAPAGLAQLQELLSDTLGFSIPRNELARLPATFQEAAVSWDFNLERVAMERIKQQVKEDKVVSMFGIRVREQTLEKLGLDQVRVVHSEAPKQKRAIVGDDETLQAREDASIDPLEAARTLEDWLRFKKTGRAVRDKVVVACEGKSMEAVAVSVNLNNIFLESHNPFPEKGKRVLIRYPLDTAGTKIDVIVVGEIEKPLVDRTAELCAAYVRIVTLNEGSQVGLYKRYVRA